MLSNLLLYKSLYINRIISYDKVTKGNPSEEELAVIVALINKKEETLEEKKEISLWNISNKLGYIPNNKSQVLWKTQI